MYPGASLSGEEYLMIGELREKFLPLHDVDTSKIGVEKRWLGQLYLEFSYGGVVPIDHHAYDEDILAEDVDGSPLGIAIFYSDISLLSKIHVFRYDGVGEVHVRLGSIRFFT